MAYVIEFDLKTVFWTVLCVIFALGLLVHRVARKRSRARFALLQHYTMCLVLGSGGHTGELLRLIARLNRQKYSRRVYVVADTDDHSVDKVRKLEESSEEYELIRIPRSREVRQSYTSSILSTLRSIAACVPAVWRMKADVVLINGPGTCVPICACAWLYRFLGLHHCVIVFVESFCRVSSLSLTGRILYHFRLADRMLVQWPDLKEKYPRCDYIGRVL